MNHAPPFQPGIGSIGATSRWLDADRVEAGHGRFSDEEAHTGTDVQE
jgi:hypothetical protein